MKILLFIPSLAAGGAERTTVNLAAFLSARGHVVGVLTLRPASADFYALPPNVTRLSLERPERNRGLQKIFGNLKMLLGLRRLLRVWQPDVVIAMLVHTAVLVLLAGRGLPCRIIAAERNYPGHQPLFWTWRILRRLLYRRADAIAVQTAATKAWLEKHLPGVATRQGSSARAPRVAVIPNAVEWPMEERAPILTPDRFVPRERKLVLSVGRLHFQKGHDLLLKAFAQLAQRRPEWDLAILGAAVDDAWRILLQKIIAEHGLEQRVKFPGLAGNLSAWFARADVFVLSSRYEGFPNVLLEAMAAGCPCVSFACDTGPAEIIQHDVNGLLVPPENVDALGEAMDSLMCDADLRRRLAQNAAKVRARFAPGGIFAEWENLCRSLC